MRSLDAKFKQLQKKQPRRTEVNAVSKGKKTKQLEVISDSEDSDGDDVFESYLTESNESNSLELTVPHSLSAYSQPACHRLAHSSESSHPHQSFDIVWMLDSGATHHVTGNPGIISNIQPVIHSPMTDAAGKSHLVKGKGKVFVQLPDGEIKCIDNVLYVPGVHRNLLSIGCIENQGYTLEFVKSTCIIRDLNTRQIFAKAERLSNRGLYQLKAQSVLNTAICSFEQTKAVQTALLWHRRLGHLNFDSLYRLSREGTVKGLPQLSKIKFTCDVCQAGKQARKKFAKSESITTKPLELIHSDVCGPFKPAGLADVKYFVTFIDDFSKKIWVYLLKSKDQVLPAFKRFKAQAENLTSHRIITFRSDNGGEYISKDFQSYCAQHGILHQRSQPYSPQSNGTAERKNRSLCETTRCLLYQSFLPKALWTEALQHACYLHNRRPTKARANLTPEEIFSGKAQDISHLRIFGTRVFVHVPK
jgi:transposase InsO family protein